MKRCTACSMLKRSEEFDKNHMGAGGLHSQCKTCRRAAHRLKYVGESAAYLERQRASRIAHPGRHETYTRRHRQARRLAALEAYGGTPPCCACCRESILVFLTIDHVNGDGRSHRREIGSKLYSWLRQQGYPSGFQVLCFNCNAGKGVGGSCPHVGQEIDKRPSDAYMDVQRAAVQAVADQEGVTV